MFRLWRLHDSVEIDWIKTRPIWFQFHFVYFSHLSRWYRQYLEISFKQTELMNEIKLKYLIIHGVSDFCWNFWKHLEQVRRTRSISLWCNLLLWDACISAHSSMMSTSQIRPWSKNLTMNDWFCIEWAQALLFGTWFINKRWNILLKNARTVMKSQLFGPIYILLADAILLFSNRNLNSFVPYLYLKNHFRFQFSLASHLLHPFICYLLYHIHFGV